MGVLGLRPSPDTLLAQGGTAQFAGSDADYDRFAKLANNENHWGPPESVMKAMNYAWKYANRYGYPDGGIVQAIAEHHGVKPENILLGAGSGEILDVVGTTFLLGGKKVVGVDPSYSRCTSTRRTSRPRRSGSRSAGLPPGHPGDDRSGQQERQRRRLRLSLQPEQPDGRDRAEAGREAAARRASRRTCRSSSTRPITTSSTIRTTRTSIPYVLEGRPVIIARTFSKIAALAGMRLGYAIAHAGDHPEDAAVLDRQHQRDREVGRRRVAQGHRRRRRRSSARSIDLRNKTTPSSTRYGYPSIPSETNFFMVSLGRARCSR